VVPPLFSAYMSQPCLSRKRLRISCEPAARPHASALHGADNGATRHRLHHNSSPVQLRGEFKRIGYRFAPAIGSLKPRCLSNTPRHRLIQPHTP
jgi:hypothetical protein